MNRKHVEKIREDTKKDLLEKLHTYKKCCLIRPTGFGKTWLLTDLIKSYKKVLYVYPTAVILDTVVDVYYSSEYDEESETSVDPETVELAKSLKHFDHVDMMTYMKLQSLSEEEIAEFPKYDIIVFDEAHIMGAAGASRSARKIAEKYPSTELLGATATPNRMDGFDIVGEFFDNVVVFPYTLHDAIQDDLLQKPIYYYCPWDIEEVKQNAIKDAQDALFSAGIDKEDCKRPDIQHLIRASVLHEANILNMDNIIRDGINKYVEGTYAKFICFFADIKMIHKQRENVEKWFRSAFPDRYINIYEVHSKKSSQSLEDMLNLTSRENTIDLICCVNMINVGYHVNSLTGILMYRGTHSNIIYIQQLGRALSSGNVNSCLVFDVVDNLHRKAVYEMKTKNLRTSRKVNPTPEVLEQLDAGQLAKFNNPNIRCRIEDWSDKGYGYVVLADGEHFDWHTGTIRVSWWREANKIEKEDLIANAYEATYKEIIAKAVAEPMSHLCREAVNLHFKRWCRDKGVKYPITRKELKEMYGIPESEWRKDFGKVLEEHGIDYPWQDAEKIMECGKVPLKAFARAKNVSIPRILELLGVE